MKSVETVLVGGAKVLNKRRISKQRHLVRLVANAHNLYTESVKLSGENNSLYAERVDSQGGSDSAIPSAAAGQNSDWSDTWKNCSVLISAPNETSTLGTARVVGAHLIAGRRVNLTGESATDFEGETRPQPSSRSIIEQLVDRTVKQAAPLQSEDEAVENMRSRIDKLRRFAADLQLEVLRRREATQQPSEGQCKSLWRQLLDTIPP
ncbi:hypothetical protein ERJ75_000334400 [Trypanosoma vivax]|nr:hypothetical protein ERJ75_000334400 [Trypanosoma vivax]